MSNIIFPALRSPNWKLTRTPFYKTMVQESASGKYVTAAMRSGKLMKWTLKNGILQAADTIADLQAIQNLFDAMLGMYDSFLYKDPESQTLTPGYDAYHPVKFLSDSLDFDRLLYRIWELGEVSFRQVGTTILNPVGTTPPQISNTAIAAALTVSPTFIAGNSGVGTPVIDALIGGAYITQIDQSGGQIGSVLGGTLAISDSQIPSLSQLSVVAYLQGTLFANATTPDTLQIADTFLTITNADSSTTVVRPTTATVTTQDTGTITNAANAIDGNPGTFATITRSNYSGLSFPTYLTLSGFVIA